jgi:tRNA threonylcarbamoyladenosine biosynthesis protein TsaE
MNESLSRTVTVQNIDELQLLADRIAPLLPRGEIISLVGEMGAGKTTLTQCLARSLGVVAPVVSPTYSIENIYRTPLGELISHLDLFRLPDGENLEFVLERIGDSKALILVEWSERNLEVHSRRVLEVRLVPKGDESRAVSFVSLGNETANSLGEAALSALKNGEKASF